MKIVVAPDSFKGSVTAGQACAAIAEGIRRVTPDAEIVSIPMADGGEGTVDALVSSTNGQEQKEIRQADIYRPGADTMSFLQAWHGLCGL